MEKLAEGIYAFSNIVANQYLLVDHDGLTLIDTGLKSNYRNIVQGIRAIGSQVNDLKNVLITHADLDHYGALGSFKQNSNVTSCTSQLEAEAIEAGRSSRVLKFNRNIHNIIFQMIEPVAMRAPTAKIDRILSPGDQLDIAGGMLVIDSKGHTPGHLSFYLPKQNILFSGDTIFLKKGKLIPSYGINCWDEGCAIESLEQQLKLSPRLICGGHGIIDLESR